jgi:hypothetical protein
MHYCPLNISDNCFDKETFVKELSKDFDPTKFHIWKNWGLRTDLFYKEFTDWLDKHNCYVFFAEAFYTPPGGRMMWHIDTELPSNFIKINFVWGSNNHIMQWGECINPSKSLTPEITNANTNYLKFTNSEIKIIDSTVIKNPTIVNIGVPHRVINNDRTGRWCLSVNIHREGSRIPFPIATSIFSEYVLDLLQP